MPWIVGIDEAGYGPNLGPFVMTSVACRLPDPLAGRDLWDVLKTAVRRRDEPDDGRLLVEDSKLVYSTARGLLDLETGVAATLAPCRSGRELSLAQYVDWACPACHPDLRSEPWYSGASSLPVLARPEDFGPAAEEFERACRREQVVWGPVCSVVVCPGRFNQILERWDSKGAVLGHALAELLAANRSAEDPAEPVWFFIDKHGGRNTYAALLQNAIPDGLVVAHEEGSRRSVYGVLGLEREIRLTFQPRADAEHFGVALASMLSKYLREVLMREFNHFWLERVPGLKPTAGYPGDAARFFAQIRPVLQELGIPEEFVWRRR
jgi:ribonuclease HII